MTYSDFLREKIESAKSKKRIGSYRSISIRLGWAPTYLTDIINGHKGLSVLKALEIALFLGLNEHEQNLLILLTLNESKKESVKAYARKKLDTYYQDFVSLDDLFPPIHYNCLVPLILRILCAQSGFTIPALCRQVSQLPIAGAFDEEDISFTLKVLIDRSFVKIDQENRLSAEKFDDPSWGERVRKTWNSRDISRKYVACWNHFIDEYTDQRFYMSANFRTLSREQLKVISTKMEEVRHLIDAMDAENTKTSEVGEMSTAVFMMNIIELIQNKDLSITHPMNHSSRDLIRDESPSARIESSP